MESKYYKIDKERVKPTKARAVKARPYQSFVIKGKIKVGDKVIRKSLLFPKHKPDVVTVVAMKYGVPFKVKDKDGVIDNIIGFLIQAIPLIQKLWMLIKDLFKK